MHFELTKFPPISQISDLLKPPWKNSCSAIIARTAVCYCFSMEDSGRLNYNLPSIFWITGLMEALMECNSLILVKLLPLWTPVMYAFHAQLPDHVKVRLQAIQDFKPTLEAKDEANWAASSSGQHGGGRAGTEFVRKWLQRMQFKMGQIEMQASNVTQFFTVWNNNEIFGMRPHFVRKTYKK